MNHVSLSIEIGVSAPLGNPGGDQQTAHGGTSGA